MNKRIKELAEQCWDIRLDGRHFDQEMFAELIVKECITVLEQHHPYTTEPEVYHYAISLIEEHFGVKE
jgi:hypothetical protein